jgi:hypothetical protein
VSACGFRFSLVLPVPGEQSFIEMDGGQHSADDYRAQQSRICDRLERNARFPRGNTGLIGEVLSSILRLSQRRRSYRTMNAARPAHARVFPLWSRG